MQLASFIHDLLDKGKVTVAGQMVSFEEEDIANSLLVLKHYYEEDLAEMPAAAPEFVEDAALWAAKYIYYAVQLTVIRNLGAEEVKQYLKEYQGQMTPGVIYSADLTLRYLPDLLNLAKGLAPGDVLVESMTSLVHQWPFSSVGVPLEKETSEEIIYSHTSLKYAYRDRIIRLRDSKRITNKQIQELIQEALGNYADELWPEWKNLNKPTIHN